MTKFQKLSTTPSKSAGLASLSSSIGNFLVLLRTKRVYVLLSVLVSIFCLAFIAMMAYWSRPIADDYEFFADDAIDNPLMFGIRMYEYYSGRIIQGLLVSSSYALFGDDAVRTLPILLTVFLVVSSACLFRWLIAKPTTKPHSAWPLSITLGALFATVLLFTLPSTYDSLIWITSSALYATAVAYLIALAAICIYLWNRNIRTGYLLGLALIVFFLQINSEPVSLLVVGSSLLVLLWQIAANNKERIKQYAVLFLASLLGLIALYFSPGSIFRREQNDTGSLGVAEILVRASNDLGFFWSNILQIYNISAILLLCIGVALFGLRVSRSQAKALLWLGASIAILVPIVIVCMTNYAIHFTAFRVYIIPQAAVFIGFILISLGLASILNVKSSIPKVIILNTMLIIFSGFTLTGFVIEASQTIRAESQRAAMVDYRDHSVARQLAAGVSRIVLNPAPLLLSSSGASDVGFAAQAGEPGWWVVYGMSKYYGIEDRDLELVDQPVGYCTYEDIYNRFGDRIAVSCNTLAR